MTQNSGTDKKFFSLSFNPLSSLFSSLSLLLSAFMIYVFYMTSCEYAFAEYPDFPLQSLISTQNIIKKDDFSANLSFRFSRWEKKVSFTSLLDKTDFITSYRFINFAWQSVARFSGGKILIEDIDIKLGGEYAFSSHFFSSFSIFLRRRKFGEITSFGFGDIFISFLTRMGDSPSEFFGGVGAFIPLAGDPDEELVVLRKINLSSFGVDIPFFSFMRFTLKPSDMFELFLYPYVSYIFRMPYIFFGQVISPGDIFDLRLPLSVRIPHFFVSPSGFAPDLILLVAPQFMYSFPDEQRTEIYTVTGGAWRVARLNVSFASLIRKREKRFGTEVQKERFFINISFFFTLYEDGFTDFGDPKYAIYRIPFMERVKPGFSSEFSFGMFF